MAGFSHLNNNSVLSVDFTIISLPIQDKFILELKKLETLCYVIKNLGSIFRINKRLFLNKNSDPVGSLKSFFLFPVIAF